MTELKLALFNKQKRLPVTSVEPLCHKALQVALETGLGNSWQKSGISSCSVSLTLVGEKAIKELNSQFRQVDAVTDILSFPMMDFKEGELGRSLEPFDFEDPDSEEKCLYLGDLVLCTKRAQDQAEAYGHSVEREVAFLVVHGLLHLLGYDHIQESDEVVMREKQRKIMEKLDLAIDSDPVEAGEQLEEKPRQRAGFITLLGRPNMGKSTLLNALSEADLAITSPKPQTTRFLIRSVLNYEQDQLIFIDSPGIHEGQIALDRALNQSIRVGIEEADILLLMIDAAFSPRVEAIEKSVARKARDRQKPLILVINKIDRVKKEKLLPLIQTYHQQLSPVAIIPISAKTGEGLPELISEIRRYLPERDFIFTEDDYTDQTEATLAKEWIRLALLQQLEDEIPHGTAVQIESFQEFDQLDEKTGVSVRSRVDISAVIYCDRESHKAVILGKNGSKIKSIGIAARQSIEKQLDCSCVLHLFVKVSPSWRSKPHMVEDLGYAKKELT